MRTSLDVAIGQARPRAAADPPRSPPAPRRARPRRPAAGELPHPGPHPARARADDASTVSLDDLAPRRSIERARRDRGMALDVEQQHAPERVTGSATLLARMVDNVIDNAVATTSQAAGSASPPRAEGSRRSWSSRTAARSSTTRRQRSSLSRSGASAQSEPDRTAAPAWASRSSPRSPKHTAAPSTSRPAPTAGSASSSPCRRRGTDPAGAPA